MNTVARLLALTLLLTAAPDAFAAPQQQPRESRQLKPLTFTNAVAFFREALRRRPVKVDKRTAIFAEGEWKNANVYNHSVIVVENADEDVEITFIMTGDEGMNWVNEFIDSRFFSQAETEALFGLSNRGLGTRRANIGRFGVELSRWEPRHHEIVVISVQPQGTR